MGHDILTGGDHLVSSGQWDPVKTYEAGLFVMEDSGGWDRAHLVYLPYCSSDAHMGDTAEDTGNLGTIQVAASVSAMMTSVTLVPRPEAGPGRREPAGGREAGAEDHVRGDLGRGAGQHGDNRY